jgi:hypothetical protein
VPSSCRHKVGALWSRELERLGQQIQGACLRRAVHAAFQITDRTRTQSRALGESFLVQPCQ